MHPSKCVWLLRALLYKPFFKHIGTMSYIGKPCFIEGCKGISIGKKTRIFPGVRMEAIGTGTISIGNNCAIQQNVHITSMGSNLIIGDNVTILACTFITNLDHKYEDINKSVMDQGYILNETIIGEGCFLGYGASIQAGTKLGKHCVVGAGAVVRGYYPDYSVIVGVPGKVIKIFDESISQWRRV